MHLNSRDMTKVSKYILYFCAAIITLTLYRCANVVSPTGGPKDEIPPIVILEEPANQSINFTKNNIHITFDEYVTLDNPNNNILISPPLEEKPEYRLHGKTLVIRFKEPLNPETTYSINFGEAIKDLHEGNIFRDYAYIFSTGNIIDTLTLDGKIVKGNDLKPLEDCFVMLYSDKNDTISLDSLPFFVKPDYVTKSNKEGQFTFSGLKDGEYLIFALKDNNSNYIYDLPNEEIAFLDSLVRPFIPKAMTISDSTAIDSLNVNKKVEKIDLTLYSFIKEDSIQKLLKKGLVEEGLLQFVFSYPAQKVKIEVMETLPDSFSIYPTHSMNYDTISWYYTTNKDSLYLAINYDTLINDTTRISLKSAQKERRKKDEVVVKRLSSKSNISGGKLRPEQDLLLTFKEPVTDIRMRDTTWFITSQDTIFNALSFVKVDSFGLRYRLDETFVPGESYKVIIPDSVFFSFSGISNDTTKLSFSVPSIEEYGNLYVKVNIPENAPQVIIELLDEGDKLFDRQIITSDGKVSFLYLSPKKYKLKAIIDYDANGKWSPGDFGKKTLPEPVYFHKDIFEIKANWDIDLEETWSF